MNVSPAQIEKQLIAEETAKMLLEVRAVLFNPDDPFIFTSGWASPVYTDMRKLIAFPRLRRRLLDFAQAIIERDIGYESLDIIAGGETAGIPYAAWLADRLSLPMQYVRKKPKGFCRNAQIEGEVREGARVLLTEDLATDGRSKFNFCNALRQAGQQCDHVFVFFFYDIFPNAREELSAHGVTLHSLATWRDVLSVAKSQRYLDEEKLLEVERFLDAPAAWSAAHGGASQLKPSE